MESSEHEHTIKNLKELRGSNFEIKDGQPDIINWEVKNSSEDKIGTVSDLLFDEENNKVRYIVLSLEGNIWQLEERKVLIPIGVAELDKENDDVILPNITTQQLNVLPDYDGDIVVSTDSELYGHKDFDEENIYARRQTGSYNDHLPYQVITRIYQEENEAENALTLLIKSGFLEENIKISQYNPLNSITGPSGDHTADYLGDGSRDEYILSLTAATALEAALAHQLLDNPID